MYEDIKKRYGMGYIRDDQLQKYVDLGVITQEQADSIKMVKSAGGGGTEPTITIRVPGVEVAIYG